MLVKSMVMNWDAMATMLMKFVALTLSLSSPLLSSAAQVHGDTVLFYSERQRSQVTPKFGGGAVGK
jgi:hypothetical protein